MSVPYWLEVEQTLIAGPREDPRIATEDPRIARATELLCEWQDCWSKRKKG